MQSSDCRHLSEPRVRCFALEPAADNPAYQIERRELSLKFGAKLRAARNAAGLSQDECAKVSGIHRSEISLIERGHRIPSLITMLVFAEALEVSLEQLAGGLKAPKRRSPRARRRR